MERPETEPAPATTPGPPVEAPPLGVPPEEPRPVEAMAVGGDEPPGKPRRQGLEWLVLVVASLAVALVVRAFLIQAFYIPSESMVPTLHKDDRVLVNKLSYRLHDVHRGDVIVFEAPPGASTSEVKDLIKRVVGLPGETIEGRGGEIYIDGKPLDEPYLPRTVRSREFPAQKVPPHRFWVLGDNRQDSKDSTFFKSINEDTIVGRAFVRIWPLKALGLL
ncbi:MAG: signal peptidase I [Acidimicrobiia bacterium]